MTAVRPDDTAGTGEREAALIEEALKRAGALEGYTLPASTTRLGGVYVRNDASQTPFKNYYEQAALDALAALVAAVREAEAERDDWKAAAEAAIANGAHNVDVLHVRLREAEARAERAEAANDGKANILVHDALIARAERLEMELHALRWTLGLDSHPGEPSQTVEESVANLRHLLAAVFQGGTER